MQAAHFRPRSLSEALFWAQFFLGSLFHRQAGQPKSSLVNKVGSSSGSGVTAVVPGGRTMRNGYGTE